MRSLWLGLGLLLSMFLTPLAGLAGPSGIGEFTAMPAEYIAHIPPGGTSIGVFAVHNNSVHSTNVLMAVNNAWPGWTCWLSPAELSLSPGKTLYVTVYATPPTSAGEGATSTMEIQFWGSGLDYRTNDYFTTIIGTAQTSNLVINSFPGNGTLAWTNGTTNVNYRIEWAPNLTGKWFCTWQALQLVEGLTNRAFSSSVPMFYRVAQIDFPPPGMALIDAGSFRMGDPYEEGDEMELPVHTVTLDSYWIERYEVTYELWSRIRSAASGALGYTDLATGAQGWSNGQPSGERGHPVTRVSWYDAVKWCNARSQLEGLTPVYYTSSGKTNLYRTGQINLAPDCVDWTANGYRLPTEAEREKAARGGLVGHHFPWRSLGGTWSEHIDGTCGNYLNSGDYYEQGTTRIGYYNGGQTVTNNTGTYLAGQDMANLFGLYDMAGNVGEWCWDCFDAYGSSPVENPHGPSGGTDRVIRDGSWYVGPSTLRCAARFSSVPTGFSSDVGLRCVRSR
jgi:formylglycine-generating enzyme required for sulfatase activity